MGRHKLLVHPAQFLPVEELGSAGFVRAAPESRVVAYRQHRENDRFCEYVRPAVDKNWWATSFVWGQNYKLEERRRTNAVLAETVVPFLRKNFITGRFEWSQRDELFDYNQELAAQVTSATGQHAFNVVAYTAGYTRDIGTYHKLQTGIGANLTAYTIDPALKPFYGAQPWGGTSSFVFG